MRRKVTRDVDPADVADLVDHPPRAHVAVVEGGRAAVLPVATRRRGAEQLVGIPAGAPDLAGREIHLVRDDGKYWFELRALAVRGVLHGTDADHDAELDGSVTESIAPAPASRGPADQRLRWYVLDPGRTVAWDYGALREAPDA
jgi:hypothetical protein